MAMFQYSTTLQALRLPSSLLNLPHPAIQSGRWLSRHLSHDISALGAVRGVGGEEDLLAPPLRRTANYRPTMWQDSFIQTLTRDFTDEIQVARLEELKSQVRRLIIDSEKAGVAGTLQLLDVLRRLGISYHFEQEIELVLSGMPKTTEGILRELNGDLLHTALFFRILREHGYDVPQDVFDSFRDEHGSFRGCHLRDDPEGMLSLYEASFLSVEGEDALEEARAFASASLQQLLILQEEDGRAETQVIRERVEYALEMPLHWRMPRMYTRWFIDVCEREGKVNPVLLELAKLDFNVVQSQHRRDLRAMSRWWKELGLQDSSFFRDRIMENFLWTIGLAFEPRYSGARHGLTQLNCLITTIDDVYDVYGTIDELEVFTKAVERWDIGAMEDLPNYMKSYFRALLNTTDELARQLYEKKGFNCLSYLKKSWIDLCKSYLTEARWYHSSYVPTLREYLQNAWISISGPTILVHAYFLLSESITREALDTVEHYGDLTKWPSMILRLSNDLGTSVDELERGDVLKSIQCHMHEQNVSESEARKHIKTMINDAWMKINRECSLNKLHLPKPFMNTAMNLARMSQFMYQDRDAHGAPDDEAKNNVKSLLIEPIIN